MRDVRTTLVTSVAVAGAALGISRRN